MTNAPSQASSLVRTTINIAELDRPMTFLVYEGGDCISSAILDIGMWEKFQTVLEMILLRQGGVFVDIGANIGWHSVIMAMALRDRGHVYAFEPHPQNHAVLLLNARENGLENITILNAACSNAPGRAPLYLPEDDNKGAYTLSEASARRVAEVDVLTADAFFADTAMPEGRLVLKIDTEGAERRVLEGARDFIVRHRDRCAIFIEISTDTATHSTADAHAITGFFRELGLRPFTISNFKFRAFPLSYDYLERTIARSMDSFGHFYGEFLFCTEADAQLITPYIHDTMDDVGFRKPPKALPESRGTTGTGARREHWCRVVMNRAIERHLSTLDLAGMAALEISGRAWEHLPFKAHFPVGYPDIDICKGPLRYDNGTRLFDIVFIEQVLEHVTSPLAALRNAHASLADGGYLVVSTPFLIKIHDAPGDHWRWTETGLSLLLQEAGFAAAHIETGSWGNRACLMANLDEWAVYDPARHSLENEPALPLVVWAFARKISTDDRAPPRP